MPRLALLALVAAACTTGHVILPAELPTLDGMSDTTTPVKHVLDSEGNELAVTPDTRLKLRLRDGSAHEYKFSTIAVKEGVFSGVTSEGQRVEYRVDDIQSVQVGNAVVGYVITVALVGALVYVVVFAATCKDTGGCPETSGSGCSTRGASNRAPMQGDLSLLLVLVLIRRRRLWRGGSARPSLLLRVWARWRRPSPTSLSPSG